MFLVPKFLIVYTNNQITYNTIKDKTKELILMLDVETNFDELVDYSLS